MARGRVIHIEVGSIVYKPLPEHPDVMVLGKGNIFPQEIQF